MSNIVESCRAASVIVAVFVFQAKATKKANVIWHTLAVWWFSFNHSRPVFLVPSFLFVFIPTIYQNVRGIDKPFYACDVCIATHLNYIPRIALPTSLTTEPNIPSAYFIKELKLITLLSCSTNRRTVGSQPHAEQRCYWRPVTLSLRRSRSLRRYIQVCH